MSATVHKTSLIVQILQDPAVVKKLCGRMPDVGRKIEYLLNTGNLASKSGLDLSQVAGFTVVAEKLNFFRYISHFRYRPTCSLVNLYMLSSHWVIIQPCRRSYQQVCLGQRSCQDA